jgi:hypothetical protein
VRFVLAIVSFIIAALLMGLGIAQKTVFAAPDEFTASTTITTSAPVTVISGAALNAYPRSQFVQIGGSTENFAAYGRTDDVIAWIGDTSYNRVDFDAETSKLVSTLETGAEDQVPSPVGSDLWLASYTDKNAMTINVPEDFSLLVVSDGVKPAPSEISITWPIDNSTPWANTLVVAGGVMLLVGLLLLFWAIAHIRKSRGPRRKSQKMPKLPRQPRYKPIKAKQKELEANAKGRRSLTSRVAIVPVVLVTALTLGGCSADFWAGREGVTQQTATPDPVVEGAEVTPVDPPAVTEKQAKRIIADLAGVAAAADAAMDRTLVATRFAGPALDLRLANYGARTADGTIAPVAPIPTGKVEVTLPQITDNQWPRAVFAVIEDPATTAEGKPLPQVAVMLTQEDPRANYKAQYVITLEPGAVIPPVAPATVGAGRLPADSKFLALAPEAIGPAYSDILMTDTASPSNEVFEAEGDTLRTTFGLAFKEAERAPFSATSTLTFAPSAATGPLIALSTNDSNAIVAVNINEDVTAAVVEAGAVVDSKGAVKALAGKPTSTKGFKATYGYQLLFFVPSIETGGKISLLGYTQGLVAASELP